MSSDFSLERNFSDIKNVVNTVSRYELKMKLRKIASGQIFLQISTDYYLQNLNRWIIRLCTFLHNDPL